MSRRKADEDALKGLLKEQEDDGEGSSEDSSDFQDEDEADDENELAEEEAKHGIAEANELQDLEDDANL